MPLNIETSRDAYLLGSAKFDTWLEDFEKAWNRPTFEAMLYSTLSTLTKEQLATLKKKAGPQLEEVLDIIGDVEDALENQE